MHDSYDFLSYFRKNNLGTKHFKNILDTILDTLVIKKTRKKNNLGKNDVLEITLKQL